MRKNEVSPYQSFPYIEIVAHWRHEINMSRALSQVRRKLVQLPVVVSVLFEHARHIRHATCRLAVRRLLPLGERNGLNDVIPCSDEVVGHVWVHEHFCLRLEVPKHEQHVLYVVFNVARYYSSCMYRFSAVSINWRWYHFVRVLNPIWYSTKYSLSSSLKIWEHAN